MLLTANAPWSIKLIESRSDVANLLNDADIPVQWKQTLAEDFGTQIPKYLGRCYFNAKIIIVAKAGQFYVHTLAHELGHALAHEIGWGHSEEAADLLAAVFLVNYVPHYTRGQKMPSKITGEQGRS